MTDNPPAGDAGHTTRAGDAETGEETGEAVRVEPDTETDAAPAGSNQTGQPETIDTPEELGWEGWLLVGAVVVSFLVVPGIVLFIPEMQSLIAALGFSLRQAYLVFPMIPAIVLGLVAVWLTLRTHSL
jgi:hypothetical protein